jgi:hypothetical protein
MDNWGQAELALGTYPLWSSLKGISALVAGNDHSLAFPQKGGLLVFGHVWEGELGFDPPPQFIVTPKRLSIQPALPYSVTSSRSRKKEE